MAQDYPPGFQPHVEPEAQPRFPPPGFVLTTSLVPGIEVYAPDDPTKQYPEVMDFKCPRCGATTAYSVDVGRLYCEHCGYSEAVEARQIGRSAEGFEFRLDTLERVEQGWGDDRKEMACQRCGGVISLPAGTLAYSCSFCGSNKVLFREPMEDVLRPRYLIPFKVSPQDCRERIRRWLGSSWVVPANLRDLPVETFHPIYIPYWIFSAKVDAAWEAEVAHEKTVVYYVNGERKEERQIEWRHESGKVNQAFDSLLVPGTTHLNMTVLSRIDRYDVSGLVLYEPRYLAGMQAQSYDLPLDDAWDAGRRVMRERVRQACLDRASSGQVRNFTAALDFSDESWRYALMPIYTSLYHFGGQDYQVLINGQTGSIAGPRPVDWQKVWLVILMLIAPGLLTGAFGLISASDGATGLGLFLLVAGMVIAFFIHQHAQGVERA